MAYNNDRGALKTDFLDGCRGLAALYVVLSHARYLLTEGLKANLGEYTAFERFQFYILLPFRYGHDAVLFFFVLSGFVIHLNQAKRLKLQGTNAEFRWGSYLYRRARRLYPPFLLAIALTYALDVWGMSRGYLVYFGKTPSANINNTVVPHHELSTLIGNLFFLMDAYVPRWGTDGPVWSLHYEWWFYMVYPLLYLLTRRSLALATGIVTVLTAGTIAWEFFGLDKPWTTRIFFTVFSGNGLIVWWLGALLAEMYVGRIRLNIKWAATLIVFLPIGLLAPDAVRGYLVSLGMGGVIAFGLTCEQNGHRLVLLEKLKWLGEMSYTLYILHFPIFVFMCGILMATHGERLPRNTGWLFVGVAFVMLVAYGAHFLVERPFLPKQRKVPIHEKTPEQQDTNVPQEASG